MFFKLSAEETGKVELLVAENVKGCTKATHLDRPISHDPELIFRFGESDGFVGSQSSLTGAETC